ncbi:hypothetical protein [Saccharolobus islandicus]|uniref:MacB-like periplasmic core domain-containing protein n=2 Tax=Saccharolobus islandicus TaxID=43080 RepID=F0NGW2_SACI5|nr:hypothetical protein [Sulfolobus islandicus]ADX82496.1 conserved hypothetical protein [Sulfolobus islandicus HVE10/4]ADX85128.1 conserved hypothetical protein [Sulfolobus islandicus REY15A]WCM36219.1 hypothetical protein GO599_00720 [Sulfolobus islandicus]
MLKSIFKQFLTRSSIRDLVIFLLILLLFLPILHLFFFALFSSLTIYQVRATSYSNLSVVSIAGNNNTLVINQLERLFGNNSLVPFGYIYIGARHGGATVEAIAINNLSLAKKIFPISSMIAIGRYPEYGVYLVAGKMNQLNLQLGENVSVYMGKNIISLRVVGILYNAFFSAEGFAILPLTNINYTINSLDNVIILKDNYTALNEFKAFLSNTKYEGLPLSDWYSITRFGSSFTFSYFQLNSLRTTSEIVETIYILISLLLIFRIRSRFSNVLALFIINGVDEKRSFKLLILPFLVIGIIPLIVYIAFYYLYDVYWYPLSVVYPFIAGLIGLLVSSILIEYYTVFSAYSNQHKFLKVRSIE